MGTLKSSKILAKPSLDIPIHPRVQRIRNVKRFVPLKGIRKKKKSTRLRGKRRRGKSRFSPNRFPDLHSEASRSASLCCRRSGPAFEIELLTLCRIIGLWQETPE